jgi:hypothetical protein
MERRLALLKGPGQGIKAYTCKHSSRLPEVHAYSIAWGNVFYQVILSFTLYYMRFVTAFQCYEEPHLTPVQERTPAFAECWGLAGANGRSVDFHPGVTRRRATLGPFARDKHSEHATW